MQVYLERFIRCLRGSRDVQEVHLEIQGTTASVSPFFKIHVSRVRLRVRVRVRPEIDFLGVLVVNLDTCCRHILVDLYDPKGVQRGP